MQGDLGVLSKDTIERLVDIHRDKQHSAIFQSSDIPAPVCGQTKGTKSILGKQGHTSRSRIPIAHSNSFSASLRAGDAHQRPQPPPPKGSCDRRRARPVARRQPVGPSPRPCDSSARPARAKRGPPPTSPVRQLGGSVDR